MIKKLLGHIEINSGLIYIGDPCYFDNEISWEHIRDKMSCEITNHIYKSLYFRSGGEGAGIVSSNHIGDGFYPVHGHFKKNCSMPFKIEINFEDEGYVQSRAIKR